MKRDRLSKIILLPTETLGCVLQLNTLQGKGQRRQQGVTLVTICTSVLVQNTVKSRWKVRSYSECLSSAVNHVKIGLLFFLPYDS